MNLNLKSKLAFMVLILLLACNDPSRNSSPKEIQEIDNEISYYVILDGAVSEDESLKHSVPEFGDDAPCVLVLGIGKTLFNQSQLDVIVERLLEKNKSLDIVYTYSYGYMRYCTIYKSVRAHGK